MIDALIERMAAKAPAATMFRSLFARFFSDQVLDEVFDQHRELQIESPLMFSHLVGMLVPVISGGSKSVNASHQASGSPYSRQALYDKLKGVEAPVSQALLRKSAQELLTARSKTKTTYKDIIPGYHAFIIDGKTYNATEHRLKESRTDARAPLPGRAIAILDTRNELFVDLECDPNAHRCERKIIEPMMKRLKPGALYLADRNFCDGNLLQAFYCAGANFIIRQHGACPSWRTIPGRDVKQRGFDSQGGKVSEQRIEVQLADDSWKALRRITVRLSKPTRNGDTEIHILTNLPSSVPARRIANAYCNRWTIETCFGYLSQALNAEIRSLCYPGAAGLCFSLALILFNMMSLIKSLLLKHGKYSDRYEITDLSYYYLADEIARAHFTSDEMIDAEAWEQLATMTWSKFVSFLIRTAAHAELARYRKHPRGPTKPRPKRKFSGARHTATQKTLDTRI